MDIASTLLTNTFTCKELKTSLFLELEQKQRRPVHATLQRSALKRIWLFIDRPRQIEYGYSKTAIERIWLFEDWLRMNMVIQRLA